MKRLEEEKREKEEEFNKKLPTYDPKTGGKSNIAFGEYQKNEAFTSVKVRAPPGGKSSITFG